MDVVGYAIDLNAVGHGIMHGGGGGRHAVGKSVGEHEEDFPLLPHGTQPRQHTPHGGRKRSQTIGGDIRKAATYPPTMTENVRHGGEDSS